MKSLLKKFGILAQLVLVTTLLLSQNVITVAALTQIQKDAIKSGARYYNTEEDSACVCTDPNAPSSSGPAIGSLEEVLQNWEADNPGSGLAVRNITDNATAEVNGASVKTSASVYKLFVARALYLLRANNNLSFNTTVNIGSYVTQAREENTKDGYTTWPWGNRTQIPISECLPEMISKSENACGWALRDFVNARGHNSYGSGTTMDPQRTTALDVVNLLQQVAQGTMVNRQSSEELEQMLVNQLHRQKIPAGIPSGVQVGNKTGEYHEGDGQLVSNDTAIVRADGITYVIAILTGLNADSDSDTAKIVDLSRQVYEVLTGGSTTGGTAGGSPCPTAPSSGSQGQAGSVYLIGDSIGTQIEGPLGSELGDNGGSLSANAATGRNLTQGIEAIGQEEEATDIRGADSVVIQLGTNASGFTAANVSAMVNKVRELNPDAAIFWVDTATINRALATSLSGVNRIIHDQSGSSNYQVISWNKAVFGESANPSAINPAADDKGYIRNADQQVHLSPEGITAMTELIAGSLSGSGASTQQPANCACAEGVSAPLEGSNEKAQVINYLISKNLSSVAVAAIAGNIQQESGFSPNASNEGNYIGIVQWGGGRDDNLRNFANNRGLPWNDLSVQLDFMWQELTTSYKTNTLDKITAPGAKIGSSSPTTPDDPEDAVFVVVLYYEGAVQRGDKYGVQEYDERLGFAQEILAELGGGSGGGSGVVAGCGAGNGIVNPNGYAYPVAPLDKSDIPSQWEQPDGPVNNHAEPKYAFDFIRQGGTPVYAIASGVIDNINDAYGYVPGCYSLHIMEGGDENNWDYWYGHIQNVTVREGQEVSAGQQIAEVARTELGSACWLGGTHVHVDRGFPRGHEGGGSPISVPSGNQRRDPTFLPLLVELYRGLPE